MKKIILQLFLSSLILVIACLNSKVSKIWETEKNFNIPESVIYDVKNDVLYVSNINGNPLEKNGKGYLSRLSTDGVIKTPAWIKGLNAPKGMGIHGNSLYVTDIDRLVIIDIKSGKVRKIYNAPSAKFLNDIAVQKDGKLYISDMGNNTIYQFNGNKIEIWLQLKDFPSPNGMLFDKDMLMIGTSRGLVRVNTAEKMPVLVIPLEGGIDGLKAYGKDSYLVSDWKGRTSVIQVGKKPRIILDTTKDKINAADIEYIKGKNLILIPTFFHNTVAAYTLR